MSTDRVYIHYGHEQYNPDFVRKTKVFVDEDGNRVFFSRNGKKIHPEYIDDGQGLNVSSRGDKPRFGLWASAKDAEYGWIAWANDNSFYKEEQKSFEFTLKKEARILEIHEEKDILPCIIKNPEFISFTFSQTGIGDQIDFDRIAEEYDGMELYISDNYGELHDGIFYTWDCDSIVIWNPDVIMPLK